MPPQVDGTWMHVACIHRALIFDALGGRLLPLQESCRKAAAVPSGARANLATTRYHPGFDHHLKWMEGAGIRTTAGTAST